VKHAARVALALVLLTGLVPARALAAGAAEHAPGPAVAGDAAYARGDLDGARTAYLVALRPSPRDFSVLCRLARVESEMAEGAGGEAQRLLTASAVGRANAAIRVAPDSAQGHLALAEALGRQAQHEGPRTRLALARQGKAEVDRALAINPRLGRGYHVRALWNRTIASRSLWARLVGRTTLGGVPKGASMENAVQDLRRAIELEPRDVSHRLELGRTYAKLDRRADARRELEAALALPPTSGARDSAYQGEARALLASLE
jgi:tetratricopeptide (TPR) repeat protein